MLYDALHQEGYFPMSEENHFDIAVVGSWHLAFVTAGCLSKLGYSVLLVNPEEIGEIAFQIIQILILNRFFHKIFYQDWKKHPQKNLLKMHLSQHV